MDSAYRATDRDTENGGDNDADDSTEDAAAAEDGNRDLEYIRGTRGARGTRSVHSARADRDDHSARAARAARDDHDARDDCDDHEDYDGFSVRDDWGGRVVDGGRDFVPDGERGREHTFYRARARDAARLRDRLSIRHLDRAAELGRDYERDLDRVFDRDLKADGAGAFERPRPGATIIAVSCVLEAVLVVLTIWSLRPEATGWLLTDCVVGAISILLMPVLWVRPIPAGYALAALAAVSAAATPIASLAVLQVSLRRKLRVAAQLAAFAALTHILRGAWRPVRGLDFTWWVVEVCAVATAIVGWGGLSRSRRALICSLRERAERAEAEQARRVLQARMAERGRIAREMHDVLAHRLTLLATYAGALEYRPETSPDRIAEAAGVIRSNVRAALVELRQVIYVLRDDDDGSAATSPPQPTLADLPRLVDESRAVGAEVHLDMRVADAEADACTPAIGRTAYRVVQEALTNARRHASGVPVLIVVTGEKGRELCIDVHNALEPGGAGDPGDAGIVRETRGAATQGSGMGLVGLTERVRLAGGTVRYGAQDGEFRLHAVLPWAV